MPKFAPFGSTSLRYASFVLGENKQTNSTTTITTNSNTINFLHGRYQTHPTHFSLVSLCDAYLLSNLNHILTCLEPFSRSVVSAIHLGFHLYQFIHSSVVSTSISASICVAWIVAFLFSWKPM